MASGRGGARGACVAESVQVLGSFVNSDARSVGVLNRSFKLKLTKGEVIDKSSGDANSETLCRHKSGCRSRVCDQDANIPRLGIERLRQTVHACTPATAFVVRRFTSFALPGSASVESPGR